MNGEVVRTVSADGLVTKITINFTADDGRILEMRWLYVPYKSHPELAWVYLGDAEQRHELTIYQGLHNISYLLRPAACVWRILEVEGLINIDNQFTVMQSRFWKQVEEVFNAQTNA